MNLETILVAAITAGFAFLGVYMSNRKQAALVAYRLEKLEERWTSTTMWWNACTGWRSRSNASSRRSGRSIIENSE